MQFTPIMYGARYFLVRELHWSKDTKWEDIIDTIFYKYFKSAYGVILEGYYRMESEDKVAAKLASAPKEEKKEASGAGDGNGNLAVDVNSPEFQSLCSNVTLQIIELMQQKKLAQITDNEEVG